MPSRSDSPGLKWRKTAKGRQPYWVAKQVVRDIKGYPDRTVRLLKDADDATLAELCAEPDRSDRTVPDPPPSPDKERLIEETSALIVMELTGEGLSDGESDFLLDHAHSVQKRIENEAYRDLHVMVE